MTCSVCQRAARGYGYRNPANPFAASFSACSMRCLSIIHNYQKAGIMFDLHHYEKQALGVASQAAGEYLDEIGKTDLATMTGDEWDSLISLVFVKAAAEIQRLTEVNAVPF